MSNKYYDSVTYIAGQLRYTLRDAEIMSQLELGAIREAKQGGNSGELVSFDIGGVRNIVNFSKVGDSYSVEHEMFGVGDPKVKKRRMKVKRSKAGRVSDDYFPEFIKGFLMPNLKEYSKTSQQ